MVANTTYGFVAAAVAAAVIAAIFALTGHPWFAVVAMCVPFAAFFVFFFATWHHAPKHPDISMTGDGDYVAGLTQRFAAAKNSEIITDQAKVIAGTISSPSGGQHA